MSALARVSAVDALVAALRARILDGELAAGERLVERELTERYDVARHTLRAALRALAVEGLVRIEPNRGARVARLDADELRELFALRFALEREAAARALDRHEGRLPAAVHDAADRLARLADHAPVGWARVAAAHNDVHRAVVEAGAAPRITRAYAALDGELALFTMQLRPVWTRARLGPDHTALVRAIEQDGPDVLRAHVDEALRALTRST